jgi:creatinine amidohydrolase/Fe(II)-dependent formamide hydrolase-like protein
MKTVGITASVWLFSAWVSSAGGTVELELMTHEEVYRAIHGEGKTVALVYNGGTEQRGPHAVLGGHTLMARRIALAIAEKLGNALVAPALPFSPTGVDPLLPGSISLPAEVFSRVNEAVVDSLVGDGFKTVVLMGDHGGGQKELAQLAALLDARYSPKGARVYYCGDVYGKANGEFDDWLKKEGYPASAHGGIPDTSLMMYLGGDEWIRKDRIVAGDPVPPPGERPDPARMTVKNGVTGDPRPSTPELGKRLFEMKVDAAVNQIRAFLQGLQS